MDPSSAYQQMSSDGMFSYNPPSTNSAASQPLSSSSFANNPSRTTGLEAYAERYRPSDSTNTGWDLMSGNSGGFSSTGPPLSNNGATSYSSNTSPNGVYSYSSPESHGTNGDYLYNTNGNGGSGDGGFSYSSSSSTGAGVGSASSYMAPPSNNNNGYPYSSSSSSYMPPSSQYNGNYDLPSETNGYMNQVPPPLPTPPPLPSLNKDELDAVERARKRQSQIPKGVFDEDFSEDENVDNAWAEYGMAPKPKHRREKVDFGQPIVNGVANGGSVPVGTNQANYNVNANNNNFYSGSYSGVGIGKVESTLPTTTQPPSSSSSTNGASSYSSAPYSTEQDRVRTAYQEWCNHYGKTFDERRLPIFKENYLAMETYCRQAGTTLKQLNEFADLSQEEYKKVRPPKKSNIPDWMLETPESKIESKEEFLTFGPRWGKEPPPGAAALLNKEAVDPLTGAKRDFQGEKRIRLAYQEWCNRNGKKFEESRLPAFTRNFVAMEQFCMTQNIPVKPLNEFADLTAAEYDVALREKHAKGETMPSFGSADASMPPPGMYSPPYQQQQQQQQQQEQQQQQYSYSNQPPPQYNNNGYSQSVQSSMGMASTPPPPSQYGGYVGPGTVTGSGMAAPQYSSGQMPPIGLTPPPLQQGYGSANAPGVPTGGTIPPVNIATNSYRGSGAGPSTNTIPTTVRPSNTPSKTEAQFKADAEARLKAFAAAKQKRKEEGEARLKRFADLKKQAKLLAGLMNVTLEEATRQVFANATAELQREHEALLERVNGTRTKTTSQATTTAKISSNTSFIAARKRTSTGNAASTNSSSSMAVALTTEEEQILKALAAVKLLSKSGEGNNKPTRPQSRPVPASTDNQQPQLPPKSTSSEITTTNVTKANTDKGTAMATVADGPSPKNTTVTNVATVEEDPASSAAIDAPPPSRQRAIVDLSAVLQIEKDAFTKDSKLKAKNKNISKALDELDYRGAKRRLDVHVPTKLTGVQASNSSKLSNSITSAKVSNPTKAAVKDSNLLADNNDVVVVATKSSNRASSDDEERRRQAEGSARKVAADTARLEEEANARAEKEAEIAKRLEAEAKERAIEEAKLKAQMKAIQVKVKAFEKARIKAEQEAKEKALEAKRLKEEVAARHMAAEAARKKADEQETRRKADEERRIKADTGASAKFSKDTKEATEQVEDAAQIVAVQVDISKAKILDKSSATPSSGKPIIATKGKENALGSLPTMSTSKEKKESSHKEE